MQPSSSSLDNSGQSWRFSPLWAYVAVPLLFIGLLFYFKFHKDTGFTSLIRFGEKRMDFRVPELTGLPYFQVANKPGYDGQFYAQIAVHPQLDDGFLRDVVDQLSYRARRIFLPLAVHYLGGGQPLLILHLYSVANIFFWFGFAGLLLHWLPPTSWSNFARWLGCVLSSGAIESVRASLTDLPAMTLILLGLYLYEKRRPAWACLPLACAGLTRETSILSSAALFATSSIQSPIHHWKRALALLGAVAPIALWCLYLRHLFPQDEAGTMNFDWPFVEIVRGAAESWNNLRAGIDENGRYSFRLVAIAAVMVQWVIFIRLFRWNSLWSRMALGFWLLLPFLGQPVWMGYWAVTRTVLPMTVAFNLLLPQNRAFWPLLVIAHLPSLHALFRLAY